MRYRMTLCCALTLGALALVEARAQAAPAQQGGAREQARTMANKGVEFFEAGQYDKALESFREAEKAFHAPTILLMIARAYDKLGRLVEAQAVYQQIIDEALASHAPPEFFEAQATAKAEVAALEERIPSIEVAVTGAAPGAAQITLDGVAISAAHAVQKNPGSHTVVVTVPGRDPVTRSVALQEGAREQVGIDLAVRAPGATPAPSPDEVASPRKGSILPAAVAFGVGGLGLGVGVVTGAMTFGKVGDLDDDCLSRRCGKNQESEYNSAHTLATLSTVSFAVGGVAAAAGVVLLVVRPFGEASAGQAGVVVGPGWAGVRGAF